MLVRVVRILDILDPDDDVESLAPATIAVVHHERRPSKTIRGIRPGDLHPGRLWTTSVCVSHIICAVSSVTYAIVN